jgi:cytoskeletal protein RodZ
MKQFNRKPMFLALALAFAAPLAFAQSTAPQSTTPQSTTDTAQQPPQDATTQSQGSTNSATPATPATPAYPESKTDMSGTTAATPATPATSASPQKKNWSDLDVDKNGTLSATEAAPVNSLSKVFTAADVNSDGELSQDEYKAYLATNGKGKAPGSSN